MLLFWVGFGVLFFVSVVRFTVDLLGLWFILWFGLLAYCCCRWVWRILLCVVCLVNCVGFICCLCFCYWFVYVFAWLVSSVSGYFGVCFTFTSFIWVGWCYVVARLVWCLLFSVLLVCMFILFICRFVFVILCWLTLIVLYCLLHRCFCGLFICLLYSCL